MLKIDDDPQYNIIGCLRKIESSLNFLAEARNYLVLKYKMLPQSQKTHEMDIEAFENKQDSIRRENQQREFQNQRNAIQ